MQIYTNCHSEQSEESRVHQVGINEILRDAQINNMTGEIHFDTPSYQFT
jgi:hypothetical protein